jgi:chloride channel protein, CIC family
VRRDRAAVARDEDIDPAGEHSSALSLPRRLLDAVRKPPDVKLVLLAVPIGLVSGLVAVVLYGGIDLGTHWLLGSLGYHPATIAGDRGGFHPTSGPAPWAKWFIPLLTAAGAFVATVIVYRVAPETRGHGTDNAISAINRAPTEMRARALPVRLIASALTIGSGGSGGTEGPTAQMAATTASVITKALKLDYRRARILVTAGLASGVGAIFRAPLGGAVLGTELLFRDDADPALFTPSLAASFTAYGVFGAFYGFSPMFGHVTGLGLQLSVQLVAFPLVGVGAGLLARLFCWGFYAVAGWFDCWRGPRPLRAAFGGLAVGAIGLYIPGVLGTGYGTIQDVLSAQHVLGLSLVMLFMMPFAKLMATALTVGSGGSGGVFGPAMVIGATAGAAMWRVLEPHGLAPTSPASLVIVGIAACLGAASHAPVAITLIAVETCDSFWLLGPTVIAVLPAVLIVGRKTLYMSQSTTVAALEAEIAAQPRAGPVTINRKRAKRREKILPETRSQPLPTAPAGVNAAAENARLTGTPTEM